MLRFTTLILIMLSTTPAFAAESIVARVNGIAITSQELDAAVDTLIPRTLYHGNVTEGKRIALREKALDSLVILELQYRDGLAKGITPDKKMVRDQISQIQDRFKSKKEYRNALVKAGISEEQLRKDVEKRVVIDKTVEKFITEKSRVDDDTLQSYYTNNINKFRQPESLRLRIFSTKDEKKGRDALAKVKGGEPFDAVAGRSSEDPYRIKGGDVGYLHRGRLTPALEDEAFKMKTGELSGLIMADGIWYILYVEDKRPEYQQTFTEAKDKLRADLESKKAAELTEKWIAALREKAVVEIYPIGEKASVKE